MTKLTISIINYKTKELTAKCLDSILSKDWKTSYKIYLVDNASKDGSIEYFKNNYPDVNLIESDKNLGFAGGHNLVLSKLTSEYVLILNSDVEALDNSLDNFLEFMEASDFSIAGCLLLNKDKSFQPNGGDLPNLFSIFVWISGLDDVLFFVREQLPSLHRKFRSYYKEGKEIGWVGGTAMMVKREVLERIGLLDDNIFMYGEDVEFCLRAKRAGFKLGWSDKAKMVHLGGGSLKEGQLQQWLGEYLGLLYIYKKYYGYLASVFLKLLIYFFTGLRMLAFFALGKPHISKTYAKVLLSI